MPPKRDPTRGKTPLPNSELSSQEPADVSPPRHVSQEGDDEEYFSHADTMRIMVATDTHVGYHERDAVCHDDSFNAWDEILTLAKLNKVDFILHGGDLFHENKPSRKTLFRCMDSIRAHCFGDDPVRIQLRSDPAKNFPKMKRANYEDPNLNVSIPIFIIHGNHDDPSGDGQLSAIDILSAAGLVNYFGRADDPNDVSIYPLLFQKGETKVAIYGLGNIRDERLYRTFLMKQVKFVKPMEDTKEWYNVMIIHQNRAQHSAKNHVDEGMLDRFLDLVIWGHEHECQQNVQTSSVGFSVLQPGSSVATSLAEGEVAAKHAFLLEVRGEKCRVNAIPLRTVRPMAIETLVLAQERSLRDARLMTNDELLKALGKVIQTRLDSMIEKCKLRNPSLLPLLRLKVDYTGTDIGPMPALRIAQLYADRIANPHDVIQWVSRRLTRAQRAEVDGAAAVPQGVTREDELVIDELVERALADAGGLSFLDQRGMHDALHKFVDKDETEAMGNFINQQIQEAVSALSQLDLADTPDADTIMRRLRSRRPPPMIQSSGRERRASPLYPSEVDESIDTTLAKSVPRKTTAREKLDEKGRAKEKSPSKAKRAFIDLDSDEDNSAAAELGPPSKRARKSVKQEPVENSDAMDMDTATPPRPQLSLTGKRPRTNSLEKFLVQPPSARIKTEPASSILAQLKKETDQSIPSQSTAANAVSQLPLQGGSRTLPFGVAKSGAGWQKKK